MKSSIHDVAKRAGVSISTVSRVINQSAGVKESKSKAVLEAMAYYEYEPNQFGRGLVKQKSNMIGIYFPYSVVSLFHNVYYLELLKGMEQIISKYNYTLLLISENNNSNAPHVKPKFLEYVKQNRIDGLIVCGLMEDQVTEPILSKLLDEEFPVAYVGKRFHKNGFNIYAQYEKYMYQMLEGLCQKGHRRVTIFLYTTRIKILKDIEKRILKVWPDFKLYIKLIQPMAGYEIAESIKENIKEAILEEGCTAICSESMDYVSTILGACKALELSVPEDVSMIFVEHKKGDGQLFFPQLDVFCVPVFEMGVTIANMLLSYLTGEKVMTYTKEFETPYVCRNSVKEIN